MTCKREMNGVGVLLYLWGPGAGDRDEEKRQADRWRAGRREGQAAALIFMGRER